MDSSQNSTQASQDPGASSFKSLTTDDLVSSVGTLQEYETQLLGFTPKSLCDGIHNAVLELSVNFLDASIKAVKNEFPESVSDERSQKVFNDLVLRVQKSITPSFDKLENYLLTNIFHIPSHVVLPEDSVQEVYQYTKEDEAKIDEELKGLKDKILGEKCMEATLKQELAQLAKAQSLYLNILQGMNNVDKACLKAGVSDVRECLKFANGTAERLSQLLERDQINNHSNQTAPEEDFKQRSDSLKF